MLIIWRFVLLLLLFLAALICFPDYPDSALATLFVMFMISFIAVLILTFLFSLAMLGHSNNFNHFFDLVIIIAVGYWILVSLPQFNGVKPLEKLKNGDYPSKKTIILGIQRLKNTSIDVEQNIKDTTDELKGTTENIEKIVVKEAKG